MQKSWWSTKWLQSAQVLRLCIIVCMRKYAVFDFLWTHHRITCKYHDFGLLVCTKDITPGGLWFVQIQFCKSKLCYHILVWEESLFFRSVLPNKPYLFNLLWGRFWCTKNWIELNWFLLRKEQQINKTSAFMVSDMLIVNYLSIFKYKHLAATYTTNFYGSSNGGTA